MLLPPNNTETSEYQANLIIGSVYVRVNIF